MNQPAGNALLETLGELTTLLPEPSFYVLNGDGRITGWNAGCERLFGYREAEMLGASQERLYAVPDVQRGLPQQELARARAQASEDEGWLHRQDGTRFWANLLTIPLFAADGRLRGWIRELRDFTARQAELEGLRQNERRYRHLLYLANEGIAQLDAGFRIRSANPRLAELLGCRVEETLGRSLLDFFSEEDARRIRECLEPGQDERQVERLKEMDFRLRRRDGSGAWIMLSIGRRYDAEGASPHLLAIVTDISARKGREAKGKEEKAAPPAAEEGARRVDVTGSLLAADRRHRAQYEVTRVLVENAPVQETRENLLRVIGGTLGWAAAELWVLDEEEYTLRCAALWHRGEAQLEVFARATRELRLSPGDGIIGQVWNTAEDLWGDTQDPRFRRAAAARQAGLHTMLVFPVTFVGRVQGVIGLYAAESLTADAVLIETLDGIGRQLGEFTVRKQSEEALARSEEQLRHVQKMDAIGTLAGGVAHDFNNMLAVISGYSELILMSDALDEASRSALDQIRSAADRAAGLTRQLLAFSRKQLLQPRRLDLVTLTSELGRLLQRVIGEDIELVTLGGPQPAVVVADPSQLEQVLMNLVVNSRDAMPKGGKLTIEVRNVTLDARDMQRHLEAIPGQYVMLAVSDTGCGMDRATAARVFEPFFTTKEPGKGTGLGLATVYGIVKQTGGEIWVYSEPGQGTTFKVFLPRADAEGSPSAAVDRSPVLGSGTILLVEDEDLLRNLIREVLSASGYEVLEAASGPEALRLLEEYQGAIQLLLTDVVMPEMSGQVLAERLLATHPQLKVLYMSGYTDDAVVRHGVQAAEVAFIQKPFSPHQLTRKLQELLRGA
jgi:PAS domain S-box-containing protein